MTGVEEVALCPWEGETLPIEHDCIGCPSPTGEACGVCPRDLADQKADLPRKLRARALAYVRDQHVVITHAWCHPDADTATARPYKVAARVRGHNATYLVHGHEHPLDERAFLWWCCGPERMETLADQCAHVAAVSLLTGWPSAAAKPAPEPEEPS